MPNTHATAEGGHPTAAEADRASLYAAVTLALTLPGDTLLYLLLPLYHATFGVTLPEAGILLAANRLVRIAGYGWVARFYATRGPRAACIVAAIGAALASLCYATTSGLWLLLAGRLVWGLSFAAMNIANQALPTASMEGAARRNGITRSIIAAGPAVGLVVGAVIAQVWGARTLFAAHVVIASLAPFVAARIAIAAETTRSGGPRFERPGPMSMWSFASGFTLDGLFFFGLGLLAAKNYPSGAVIAAGLAMALRYVVEVVVSPLGGALARGLGARVTLILLSLGAALGLALLAADGWLLWAGILIAIVLRALIQTLSAPLVAETFPGPERVSALARQATWRDIGAGTGPLAAGVLLASASPLAVYGGAAILLAVTSLMLTRLEPRVAASAGAERPPKSR